MISNPFGKWQWILPDGTHKCKPGIYLGTQDKEYLFRIRLVDQTESSAFDMVRDNSKRRDTMSMLMSTFQLNDYSENIMPDENTKWEEEKPVVKRKGWFGFCCSQPEKSKYTYLDDE